MLSINRQHFLTRFFAKFRHQLTALDIFRQHSTKFFVECYRKLSENVVEIYCRRSLSKNIVEVNYLTSKNLQHFSTSFDIKTQYFSTNFVVFLQISTDFYKILQTFFEQIFVC